MGSTLHSVQTISDIICTFIAANKLYFIMNYIIYDKIKSSFPPIKWNIDSFKQTQSKFKCKLRMGYVAIVNFVCR